MAVTNDIISGVTFCGGLGIVGAIGYKDSEWINEHFIEGEWI
jgi:hypothetical protein